MTELVEEWGFVLLLIVTFAAGWVWGTVFTYVFAIEKIRRRIGK